MARMMNALQLALGSVGSGIQGYAQARAQREEQERKQAEAEQEQSRVAAALARQSSMDAMAMEDREQAKQDRLQAQRASLLKGGYVPKGMDMPGATPRQAVSTEMVDGQEYNLYSTPRQMAMQAAMEEAALKKKFAPEDKMTAYQAEMIEQRKLDRQARASGTRKDDSDKASKASIDKVIAGGGKVVAASRAEEKIAETQLARLDRERPDPNRFTGTDEELAAAEAAWQKKVDAAQKRLDVAQAKTARIAPTYEESLVTRDTTGYGEAFPAKQQARTPFNTEENALAKEAGEIVKQWMQSGAPKAEIDAAVSKINNRLTNDIRALRSRGK